MTSTHTENHADQADTTDGDTPATAARHPAVEHLLKKLMKEPRPPHGIGLIGRHFITLGQEMANEVPDDPELSVALRHLLDARNAFTSAHEDAHPTPTTLSLHSFADPHSGILTFGFGHALIELRAGNAVARTAWGPTGVQYLTLVPGSTITVAADRPLGKAAPHLVGATLDYVPHIDRVFHTYNKTSPSVTVWTPETADLLADDWHVVRNGDAS